MGNEKGALPHGWGVVREGLMASRMRRRLGSCIILTATGVGKMSILDIGTLDHGFGFKVSTSIECLCMMVNRSNYLCLHKA